jgi:SnoaL-like domain
LRAPGLLERGRVDVPAAAAVSRRPDRGACACAAAAESQAEVSAMSQVPNSTANDDRSQIRELIENWVVWRDAGDWQRFRSVWHADGVMMATWFQGSFEEFIRVSQEGWDKGLSILHFLGGISIDLGGARAIAQSKMTISQRSIVEGELADVVCTGRFYDFLEKREGRWGIVLRQPIYEKDSIVPVDPSARIVLDKALLERFPIGYRHLAYLQTQIGYKVKPDMPGLKGERVEALYALGAAWLQGGGIEAWG